MFCLVFKTKNMIHCVQNKNAIFCFLLLKVSFFYLCFISRTKDGPVFQTEMIHNCLFTLKTIIASLQKCEIVSVALDESFINMKMAYVLLDGDRKPEFRATEVSNLSHDVVERLCEYLNPPMMREDYRSLAGKMKFSHRQVKNIDTKSNPTEELIGRKNEILTSPGQKH